jgi:hypothetical protein
MEEFYKPSCEYWLAVDIGIRHLGLVLVEVSLREDTQTVVWFERIDVTRWFCRRGKACSLPHTRTFSDWLAHVFFEHQELFEFCNRILIERQPPVGHVAIEQLFFFRFREKAVLIHPRSVHAFLGWGASVTYDDRKLRSERIFERQMELQCEANVRPWLRDTWHGLGDRRHDVADAYTLTLFYRFYQRQRYDRGKPPSELDFLDAYRYEHFVVLE